MARRNIDRQALRQQIQELDIDNELKSQLLDAVSEQKKYGLVWENHKEDAEELLREKIPVLTEEAPLRLSPGGEGAPNHILIEGDNLHALTALTYTHEGKVDVIYIDPPYNTGNKDFVYNDSFVDSEDGYRHSKWLSFMEKRLRIAKKLLSDDGCIFISIDNNENAQLRLLCDDILGEENFVTTLHVEMSATQGMKVKAAKQGNIVKNGEYILVYKMGGSKNVGSIPLLDPVKYDNHYNLYLVDEGDYFSEYPLSEIILRNIEIKNELKTLRLLNRDMLSNKNISKAYELSQLFREWVNSNCNFICRVHDSVDVPSTIKDNYIVGKVYKYNSETRSYYVVKNNDGSILQRIMLSEKLSYADDYYHTFGPTRIRGDWWQGFYLDMGNIGREGGIDYKNGKKPVRLIKQIVKFATNKENATVLDFFAGSGTTGHAVMELNSEDNKKRQFILMQSWEKDKNTCLDITYKRIYNVINDLATNNLRYYKVDFVERENSHNALREQVYAMTDLLCIKEGIYTERTSFGSLPLDGKEKMIRYFANKEKQMLMVYDSRVIQFVVSEIAKMDDGTNIKVYLFADGSYPYTADFDDVLNKVTLIAMPYAMNSALKNVLPAKEEEIMEGEPENIDDND